MQEPCVTTENEKSFQPSVFSNQEREVDGQQTTDDGKSQWEEDGGLGEGLEQEVTTVAPPADSCFRME